jgi:manganese transport protein
MTDMSGYDPYALPASEIQEPPVSLWAALKKIGPGIVLAGTIVGSGELLLTTKLGAEHGYLFLWLILFSCVVKVFVQTELGRYAISSGKPTLGAIDELPGMRLGAHWLAWWWLIMMLATIFQLGAMTGTIGQALNLTFPAVSKSLVSGLEGVLPSVAVGIAARPEYPWAVLTCLTTIALLWKGDYRRIEVVTTALVVGVTLLTVTAALALPFTKFPILWPKVGQGLMFGVPATGIAAAFGVFGITGVGASELFYYPYWCLEKGYARYAGKCDNSETWTRRAKGWVRVMYLDAWVSMLVFTISTVAFYFMGAAVLHPQGLVPEKKDMIETLSRMFVDTFGGWTQLVFLVGAAAVLFKTLYLSSAGNGRLVADFLGLAKFATYRVPEDRGLMIHWLSISIPIMALTLFAIFGEPASMVVIGGFGQALTLPMITAATIYFRYRKLNRRLTPSIVMDICLWVALVLITLVAGYALRDQIKKVMAPAKPSVVVPAIK